MVRHKRSVHLKQRVFFCGESTCPRAAPDMRFPRKDKLLVHLRASGHCANDDVIAESSRAAGKRRRVESVPSEETVPLVVQHEVVNEPILAEHREIEEHALHGFITSPYDSPGKRTCCEESKREVERLKEVVRILLDVIKRLHQE